MGVDYHANFGLAIKVVLSDKLREDIFKNEESEYYSGGDIEGFLDYFIGDSPFSEEIGMFQVGASNYTGKENDYYIYLIKGNHPLLSPNINVLAPEVKTYLVENGITTEEEGFCIQGGLLID